jgi:hypothetical protein
VVATVDPPCDEDHEAETHDRDRRELPDRGKRDATDEPGSQRGAPAEHDRGDSSNWGETPVTHR